MVPTLSIKIHGDTRMLMLIAPTAMAPAPRGADVFKQLRTVSLMMAMIRSWCVTTLGALWTPSAPTPTLWAPPTLSP